jgi:hypothetical protein
MSESEETKWRLGTEPEEAEQDAAELSSEEDEKKEELQGTVQTKAEEIGGGGEGSLVTREEAVPAKPPRKRERVAKAERPTTKKEPDSNRNMEKIAKELERQANRLTRVEKAILPLQRSVNKIEKQTNTIKQIYAKVTQLQGQTRSTTKQGAQNKKGKKYTSRPKRKRSPSSR